MEASVFLRLTKVDPLQGIVSGVMATGDRDADRERLDYRRSKPYFIAWSNQQRQLSQGKSLGNVRLQHDAKRPVGVLTALDFDDDQELIRCTAQIADPLALNLLRIGALTGFSIGGAYASKTPMPDGTVLYIAIPSEVSLCDRPCNPEAVFESVKSDGTIELRKFWNRRDVNGELISILQKALESGMPQWYLNAAFNLPLSVRKELKTRSTFHRQELTARRLAIRKSRGWQN